MKDERTIELEYEMPGSPEQLWQAIATGAGISTWLAPSMVEERKGGAVSFNMAEDMTSKGVVTIWEPNRRFAYVENEWMPGAPPLTSDFQIDARPGGQACRLRITTRLDEATPEMTQTLRMMQQGWAWQFNLLRLHLTHFPGQKAVTVRAQGDSSDAKPKVWSTLAKKLGLFEAVEGERRSTPKDVPRLVGIVDRSPGLKAGPDDHDIILRLDEPTSGYAMINVWAWGGPQTHATVMLTLYGPEAQKVATREEQAWRTWMKQHFPPAPQKRDGARATHA